MALSSSMSICSAAPTIDFVCTSRSTTAIIPAIVGLPLLSSSAVVANSRFRYLRPHCKNGRITAVIVRRNALQHAAAAAAQARDQHSQSLAAEEDRSHGGGPPAASTSYTSMRADPLSFWTNHQGLILHHNGSASAPLHDEEIKAATGDDQCSTSASSFLSAELQLLKSAASDRAEMHAILAQQRDNWNKLFQRTLTATSMTACILSGVAGAAGGLQLQGTISMSLPALLLNAVGAAMMAIINQFQPSQLAEEQRTAARLFRKLASDVQYALSLPAHLRQHTPSFLRDCKRRLQALDKAFPMPLTPGGLEKFPAKVLPPVLIQPISTTSHSADVVDCQADHSSGPAIGTHGHANTINGWDKQLIHDLQDVASLVSRSDIPKYTGWSQNLVKVNKCLAIAAPLCAASAALLNALMVFTSCTSAHLPIHNNIHLGMWAATCSVLAAFAGSFSNDMQLGMVFELYRNSAGYYADTEVSIKEMLDMPVQHREHGELFRQRIAYQLGRWPMDTSSSSNKTTPLVPADAKEAGTLF